MRKFIIGLCLLLFVSMELDRGICFQIEDKYLYIDWDMVKLFESNPNVINLESLKEFGVLFPDVAYAQSTLETGHFNSTVFRENNNGFGMKHSRHSNNSLGTKNGHAEYGCIAKSIKDYRQWQLRRLVKYPRGIDTIEEYLDFLECVGKRTDGSCMRYAVDPSYIPKLKDIMSR